MRGGCGREKEAAAWAAGTVGVPNYPPPELSSRTILELSFANYLPRAFVPELSWVSRTISTISDAADHCRNQTRDQQYPGNSFGSRRRGRNRTEINGAFAGSAEWTCGQQVDQRREHRRTDGHENDPRAVNPPAHQFVLRRPIARAETSPASHGPCRTTRDVRVGLRLRLRSRRRETAIPPRAIVAFSRRVSPSTPPALPLRARA